LEKEVPKNFGSYADADFGYGPDSPWQRSALLLLHVILGSGPARS